MSRRWTRPIQSLLLMLPEIASSPLKLMGLCRCVACSVNGDLGCYSKPLTLTNKLWHVTHPTQVNQITSKFRIYFFSHKNHKS